MERIEELKACNMNLDFGRCLWKRESDKHRDKLLETCREPKMVGPCRNTRETLSLVFLSNDPTQECVLYMTEDKSFNRPFSDDVEAGYGCLLDGDGWFGYWCFDFHVLNQRSNQDLA